MKKEFKRGLAPVKIEVGLITIYYVGAFGSVLSVIFFARLIAFGSLTAFVSSI